MKTNNQSHLMNIDLSFTYPEVARASGVHLYDEQGKAYLDGCSGALVANLGHGVKSIGRAMAAQAEEAAYVYRFHMCSKKAGELAGRFCNLAHEPSGRVFFTNSGSEANEMAVKLARAYHLANGEPERFKIISRWQSYHGITMAALSWSGHVARRSEFAPYMVEHHHIPPAYCFRCPFGHNPDSCGLECAGALERAILNQGPETVAAFLAEPVVGAALGGAPAPAGYLPRIREICDKHGVLFIADEVMTGGGRCGKHYFACAHFGVKPDITAFGKGASGGYYPLAGAVASGKVAGLIREKTGGMSASQSFSAHPVGMAAGLAALDYFEDQNLAARAAKAGRHLEAGLEAFSNHPSVGDIRGLGLMWGIEFVQDKQTAKPFDPKEKYFLRIYHQARIRGLHILPSNGCVNGGAGDIALIGPPLCISRAEIDEMCSILDQALSAAERDMGM